MDQHSTQKLGIGNYNYALFEEIGQGCFGKVYRGKDGNGDIVAIKVISETTLNKQNRIAAELLQQEINTMYTIKNPNVVRIFNHIFHKQNHYIVMEYCDSGNLRELLDKQKGMLTQEMAIGLFKQIMNGIKGLHEKQIMHRDLKLENIFFHKNKYVKIGDLGFSKKLKHKDDLVDLYLGSPGTIAPEVVKHLPYGFKADIFSLGVLLYEMLYGKLPFNQIQNDNQYLLQIKNNKINFDGNPSVTKEVKDLIVQMLKEDPIQRIDFIEIWGNPLFHQLDITQQSLSSGLNLLNMFDDQINRDQNVDFYSSKPVQEQIKFIPYNQYMQLSDGKGLIDWSQKLNDMRNQQNSAQQQQNEKKIQNKYITPRQEEDYEQQIIIMSPPQNSDTLQNEKLINELFQKYLNRFNSIQYLLNTLNDTSGVGYPNVFAIIYPQMILHKKAIVEFQKFYQQLINKENIFDSPVFEKIIQSENLSELAKRLKLQISTQVDIFLAMYKPQVDENEEDLKQFIQRNWLKDNQLEPSEFFNENYIQGLHLLLDIIKNMQNQSQAKLVKLDKLRAHLSRCLDFKQLINDEVQLSMEFALY